MTDQLIDWLRNQVSASRLDWLIDCLLPLWSDLLIVDWLIDWSIHGFIFQSIIHFFWHSTLWWSMFSALWWSNHYWFNQLLSSLIVTQQLRLTVETSFSGELQVHIFQLWATRRTVPNRRAESKLIKLSIPISAAREHKEECNQGPPAAATFSGRKPNDHSAKWPSWSSTSPSGDATISAVLVPRSVCYYFF